jgi:proton-translocating NADH-quinone oxidoreductase chain L
LACWPRKYASGHINIIGSNPMLGKMLLVYVFFPFIHFIIAWFTGTIFGKKNYAILVLSWSYIVCIGFGLSAVYTVSIESEFQYITLGTWINCGLFVVNWGFIFDTLSVNMLFMVSIISSSVHFYALGYMKEDPCLVKFLSYLSLFTFFMFILVTADNFVQLFLGWEGVGLCSYLLISFWSTRVQANKAALKAFIINRVGDYGFICGFLLIFYFFKTLDFSVVFVLAPYYSGVSIIFFGLNFFCLDIICALLFIGAMSKSAQVGLHAWLPDAMEGPTPVSALIHAATLVTAGVFLIIRCSPIFEYSCSILFFITIVGGITAFFSATVAITQNDIKKVIAYSTTSQLGYMVFICGLSSYNVAMFHLVNHAFFKALLFLSAGAIIHSLSGEQDMRRYGGLIKFIPYTYSMMLVGFFSLAGIPFLSGFYSKDLILEIGFAKYTVSGLFVYWLGTSLAGLTAFYSFRVVSFTFFDKSRSYKYYIQNAYESCSLIGCSLFILCFGSIFSGFFLKDAYTGFGNVFWGNSIFITRANSCSDAEYIPFYIKNIPTVFSFCGIFCSVVLNNFLQRRFLYKPYNILVYRAIDFFNKKWYFDYLYNKCVGKVLYKHSFYCFYKLLDRRVLSALPQSARMSISLSSWLSKKQSGFLYYIACLLLLSAAHLIYFIQIF